MASERFEMRVPDGLMARLDLARGFEPRASFVKRALESALGGPDERSPLREPTANPPQQRSRGAAGQVPASSRASVKSDEALAEVPLPKIAPRRR